MDINRFTEKAQEAVRAAQTLATRYSNQQIEVEHLLQALLDQQGGLVPSILARAGVNVEPLKGAVEREINKMPKVTGPSGPVDQVYITARLNKVFVAAEDEAKKLKDEYVSVEHLLLAIVEDGGAASRALKTAGATRDRIEKALMEGPRPPASHFSESGSHLRSSRTIRARSHQDGGCRKARSGDRP